MHGDHTPLVGPGPATLTPLGADQMYDQGSAFRDRYLQSSSDNGFVGIVGMRHQTIDNSQLNVESSTDEYSAASAMAFMQGLYPPRSGAGCDPDSPEDDRFSNGLRRARPLCGYEYPNIRTIAPNFDPDTIWGQGHNDCTKQEQALLLFPNQIAVDSLHHSNKDFYTRLWNNVFCEAFPLAEANFYNAHDLYDYATYRWIHDSSRSALTSGDMDRLRQLAWQEQSLKHAAVSSPGGTRDDLTHAIAGRTLASRTAALFTENIRSVGARNKLNLAFTSHEPFIAFFALTGLTEGPSSGPFRQLPSAGAPMTFELFSVDPDSEPANAHEIVLSDDDATAFQTRKAGERRKRQSKSYSRPYDSSETCTSFYETSTISYETTASPYDDETTPHESINQAPAPNYGTALPASDGAPPPYPSVDKLNVRFLYRNSTDGSGPLVPFPLFGGSQTHMSFKHFNATMWSIGIANATTWCKVCDSDTFFCDAADPPGDPSPLLLILMLSGGALLLILLIILVIILLI